MKKKHRENLRKFAKWVYENVAQDAFNMKNYITGSRCDTLKDFLYSSSKLTTHNCGAQGCLLGYAPSVLPISKILYNRDDGYTEFLYRYSKLVFGVTSEDGVRVRCREDQDYHYINTWAFLFSGRWAYIDNSVEHAVKRLIFASIEGNKEFIEMKEEIESANNVFEHWKELADKVEIPSNWERKVR